MRLSADLPFLPRSSLLTKSAKISHRVFLPAEPSPDIASGTIKTLDL
jgi:hypothetical protein